MENYLETIEPSRCRNCGSELRPGYVLGKHNRIRWSVSSKGMTIFHGVPLIKLKKNIWSNWRNWLYAPNIPATRCENCKLVIFTYDNDEAENPEKELYTSSIMAGLLIISGLIFGIVAIFWDISSLKNMFPFRLLFLLIAITILVPGAALLRHAIAIKKSGNGN
jgi:hypothetical protein